MNAHVYVYACKATMFFPNCVHISSCSCVTSTQLSIKLNSISGSWQTIRGMFHGFGLQTNHLCTTKMNTEPRSQNDFPACIFLLLWTPWLTAERWWERKSRKQPRKNLMLFLPFIKMSGILIVLPKEWHIFASRPLERKTEISRNSRISAQHVICSFCVSAAKQTGWWRLVGTVNCSFVSQFGASLQKHSRGNF